MKSMVIDRVGGPDVFSLRELPMAAPGPGEVRVRVRATSVNPIDTKLRSGAVPLVGEFPAVLHVDVAGEVGAVGEGVSGFGDGDRVYGFAGGVAGLPGALSEYVCVPASQLALMPANLDFAEAAALPVAAVTAWEALHERARVSPGMRVLVHGGAGGVGHVAVQLARAAGARVHATVSGPVKADLVRRLGAEVAIDYRDQTVADYVRQHTAGQGYDVVLDTVGGENLVRSLEAARPGGVVVCVAARGVHDLSLLHGKGLALHGVFSLLPLLRKEGQEQIGDRLRQVSRLVESEVLHPLLDDARFGFRDVALAHARLESGRAVGKLALNNDL